MFKYTQHAVNTYNDAERMCCNKYHQPCNVMIFWIMKEKKKINFSFVLFLPTAHGCKHY